MVRFLGIAVSGVVIGVTLVFVIGVYGVKTRDSRPAVERTALLKNRTAPEQRFRKAPVSAPDRAPTGRADTVAHAPPPEDDAGVPPWMKTAIDRYKQTQPTAWYLRADGYGVGPDLEGWSEANRAALAAYLQDWNLPAAGPDADGFLGPDLMARLTRSHKATRPQWVTAALPACRVWIEDPLPGEKTSWSGPCNGRAAEGEGTLTREYTSHGQRVTIGFTGTLVAGRANGAGQTVTVRGQRYDGMHVAGRFEGEGVLTEAETGEVIYRGTFKAGYPHGRGLYRTPGGMVEATWEMGCLADAKVTVAVLRHPDECTASEPGLLTGAIRKLFD